VRAVAANVERGDWLVLIQAQALGQCDTFDVSLRATLDHDARLRPAAAVDALEDRSQQLVAANKRLHQIDDLGRVWPA
jgi:hypothetical protein